MSFLEQKFSLAGKTALVTGSTRGIGFALAAGLAKAGAHIIINGRNQNTIEQAQAKLAGAGIDAHSLCCDVADSADVAAAIDNYEAGTGAIDILVNNAGIQHRAELSAFTDEDFNRVMNTNSHAVFYTAKAAGKHMVARGHGKIINIASVMTLVARQNVAAYVASKAAVGGLTRALATEWAEKGLNINAIGPGYISTELTKPLFDDAEFSAWLMQTTPQRRWGQVDDLVGAAIFLASPASDFVNGQILYVDGGMTASV
jgi:gluconate 5-dehydrogenase